MSHLTQSPSIPLFQRGTLMLFRRNGIYRQSLKGLTTLVFAAPLVGFIRFSPRLRASGNRRAPVS